MQSVLPTDTASGAIASFPDGADDAPVKSLVAQIAPVQSGSGDPSPTNIRHISGWTGVNVTRTGADNQSDTYTIAFPAEAGTVYGGTLDAANGVLTVDSAIVDMGTLNWMYYSNQQRMVAQVNSAKPAVANVGLDGACSVYKVVNTGYRSAPDKSIVIGNNFISDIYAAMVVHDEDYTDAETFKTAVSGQTLVFPIKNPVTYQLDPVTVTTLLGVNNIWADTGDVAVDYRADTGLYIQKLTGSTEEDMIADAPIASGKYFLVGNTLYLSTAAIAAGATLTPGTNCVKTNLAEALNALNS